MSAPGPLGGCGMRVPDGITADAAFYSSWASTKDAVQRHARAMGRPLSHHPDAEQAEEARLRLLAHGVRVILITVP